MPVRNEPVRRGAYGRPDSTCLVYYRRSHEQVAPYLLHIWQPSEGKGKTGIHVDGRNPKRDAKAAPTVALAFRYCDSKLIRHGLKNPHPADPKNWSKYELTKP